MKMGEPRPEQSATVEAIVRELKNLDEAAFPALHALAENELFRLRGGIAESIDLVSNRQVKIRVKVDIPQTQYPTVNFVGKLLGPGGSTLRAVQESTKTKMAILGAGSLRDEAKERELLSNGDPKYQHLKQKLHLQVDSLAPPAEAYYRLSHALAELRKIMLPESTEFPPPPWVPAGSPSMVPRGGGPMRGGRSPHPRGGFVPTAGSPTFRGRGKPWLNRGAAANGTPVIPPPPPAPVVQEAYNNGTQPAVYPTMPVYEQADYTANVYEDFGASYGQDDSWGKVGLTDARGRGRAHPYARPGMKTDQQ
ncbi:KH domain containing RNA binding signal [Fasciolopsis buskii]|uniref:KH domain containing RNA binding signal n=1 Tax=Fasciolopsis buskii TaxID=27845 RepID=A0A8E0VQ33_9TREM|nr:KH domain containing RNA binding signal [Fasciolopsis buski]